MNRARTIMVGASHWHVPLYAAAIAEVHRVVGVSDEDPERVRGLSELWDAPVETDWRRLLELPDVELAYVFGPHDQTAPTCLALIQRGHPVRGGETAGHLTGRRAAGTPSRRGSRGGCHRAAHPAGRSR